MIMLALFAILVLASVTSAYMWFKPHRNIQKAEVFAEMNYRDLLSAFEKDPSAANEKFLSSDGNSKVLVIKGPVYSVTENQLGEQVVIIKSDYDKVGVSATFIPEAGEKVKTLKKGEKIHVKGQIISGNCYDADLDLYEHAVLVQANPY
jgi:hypothetical protein